MFTTISTQRLSAGSVYKLWLIGLGVSLVPLGVLLGVLAMFGFNTVTWNGQPIHGVKGLIGGPIIGALLTLLFTAILGSVAAAGLWLYSKFQAVSLRVKNVA
jgi:hypothetical protein